MNLTGWIQRLFTNTATNTITTSQELAEAWLRGPDADAGVMVNLQTVQGVAAYAACVRVLSNAVAHLPLAPVHREHLEGGAVNQSPALDRPEYRMLRHRPNVWQTSFQLRKLWMRDLLYRGNAYGLKVPGRRPGTTQEVVRLHPDRTTPEQDKTTLDVRYRYTRPDGREAQLARAQVVHIWGDSEDGVTGLNPIQVHRNTIGDAIAQRQHGSSFFKNAARLAGVLTTEQQVGRESKALMRKDFEDLYTGGANAHRTAILDQGFTFTPVSISMRDAQWIEGRKLSARDICGILGVPPDKIGDLSDATFSNIEHQGISFVTDSLMPWLKCIEQCLHRDLFDSDPDLVVEFNPAGLLRGTFEARQKGLHIQRRNGVINANEWRQLEGMNARDDEGGDEYIVESAMRIQDGNEPAEGEGAA